MSYQCKILADSADGRGNRLVTYEIVLPRMVLAEFNTHCMLSRNSASSRALPVDLVIRGLLEDTFFPERFGINQSGMQSVYYLEGQFDTEARSIWKSGRDRDLLTALELLFGKAKAYSFFGSTPDFDIPATRAKLIVALDDYSAAVKALNAQVAGLGEVEAEAALRDFVATQYLNTHKQYANRVLETYPWHTIITTATEWSNFFAQRNHPDAQPEIRTIASMMEKAYDEHNPVLLAPDEWHLPLLQEDELVQARTNPARWARISAARCARVSYLTHDGRRDPSADEAMFDRLTSSGHMSPLEHIGYAMSGDAYDASPWSGKLCGFVQYRKVFPNEGNFAAVRALMNV